MIFNVFRIVADFSHLISKIILLWAIHWNRSAEGVSLITQVLYLLVFCTRYLDLFQSRPFEDFTHTWLFLFKIFYIASSAYTVFLMTSVYARTREREKAWKFGMYCLGGSIALAIPVTAIFQRGPMTSSGKLMYLHEFKFMEILWVFSEILESVCVLPQLLLLRQTTVPTVIDSYYLVCLGSYRAFYILNWIQRAADKEERHFDPISVLFGIIQTALYIDFAWVYYTRQRVKLRAGGVVDSEDLARGWLVGRFTKHHDLDEEEEPALGRDPNRNTRRNNKWGQRGISVSADDGVHDVHAEGDEARQPLTDPQAFEDDLTDDEGAPPASSHANVGDGSEWADEASATRK
ncbi:uncharacterized protein PV09_00029 [Verruconis gallopava]|uniref:ER lumen protein retaining receptor n=1 Tax=Verruconis gallopava TaxID=253628 RepID=A0A0D2AQX4_9PEZI|nr:uncharacterized protein PV09_00029 [Verruconis gallopava]KIW09083.1 hypothetical protein PV09_00029 [Verruconis gallopava]